MLKINIPNLVKNISEKNSVYTPLIEAIVNSLQSIEANKTNKGQISVVIKRNTQVPLESSEEGLAKIISFEVIDNGEGFTQNNRDSFNILYTDKKIEVGGKGFGRFMFLKYFNKINIDSVFKDGNQYFHRTFDFSMNKINAQDLIDNEKILSCEPREIITITRLDGIKEEYSNKIDKKIETIARILVEKLLPYFINTNYTCPTITLEDTDLDKQIVLNNYFTEYKEIQQIGEKDFKLTTENGKESEKFEIKIFKIFHTQSSSSIILSANNRAVTVEPLHEYIPEFKDDFFDEISSDNGNKIRKNYSIKAYVMGEYLNKHVSLERSDFEFPKNSSLLFPFSRKDIELEAVKKVEEAFSDQVLSRKLKKSQRIKEYVNSEAPWHKSYFEDLDLSSIPYDFDEITLEGELQKLKFAKELELRKKVTRILEEKEEKVTEKVAEISAQLTEIGKSDLAHYVVLRKVILDILKKSLAWDEDKKYEKEKIVHDLIFPLNRDSDQLSYEQHNLWLVDERLAFNKYVMSDKPLNQTDERPDLLIFDQPILIREDEEPSNPITIFEFKRPQRTEYTDEEDPILQIFKYVKKIKSGNFKDISGRVIKVTENTPAFGFLVCDLTPKIHEFCVQHDLSKSPDGEGYFGYHKGYKIYIEVISFDKLLNDSELRNKIFFKKLGIS